MCDHNEILFSHEGGSDVGDVDVNVERLQIPIGGASSATDVVKDLLSKAPVHKRGNLSSLILSLYNFYKDLRFLNLEINPLDIAAKLDDSAVFLCTEAGRR